MTEDESNDESKSKVSSEQETNSEKESSKAEDQNKKHGTISLSVNTIIIGAFALGLAVGFSGGILTLQGTSIGTATGDTAPANPDDGQPSDTGSQDQEQENTDTIDMSQIDLEGEPVLGQADAPVTMVVYEDFECPFCKRFEEGAVQQIKSNYVDSGQVKIVWKDRPLAQLHPWAEPAAAAMECVYREGGNSTFWSVKEKVFANQNTVETSNIESKIKSWASEEGVSESAVQSCIDNENPMEEVNADSTEGQNLGASGTPTSFINGQKIVGAQPYSNFKSAIDSALS